FYYDKNFTHYTSEVFTYVLAILLPLLMVSKFKYDTMPKFSLNAIKSQPVKSIIIFIIIILIIGTRGEGLFAFCLFYLGTGIFRGLKNALRRILGVKKIHEEKNEKNLKLKSSN
ncbi:MAG TPA: hypothetical protein VGK25_13440, partial [Ignavibacteria bacterium]